MEEVKELSMEELIKSLEKYNFECEAGYLKGCAHWIELKRRVLGGKNEKDN